MRLEHIFKSLAPVVALAAAEAVSRCGTGDFQFNGKQGLPLDELDLTGPTPRELVLLGPDTVIITQGEKLTITAEGDGAADLRFVLADGSLGIMHHRGETPQTTGPATVHVTLPPLAKVVLAGSGTIHADALAGDVSLSIAGSGTLESAQVAADRLELSIAGSGACTLAGTADKLKLSIAGSGDARLGSLKVGKANVSIAGSGSAVLACDGEVKASLMGSGDVTVRGSARCKVSSMGSGTLVCERA